MHLGPLHVVGMLATIGLIVGIGVYSGRKVASAADFSSGGGKAGAWIVCGAIMGTLVSGQATIGTAQLAFSFGMSAWWFTLGSGIGCLILAIGYAAPFRRSGCTTLLQVVSQEYGPRAETAGSIFCSVGIFISVVAQVLSATALLTTIFPLSHLAAALISILLMGFYVIFGGMWGAGMGGVAKLILLYASAIVGGILVYGLANGFGGLLETLEQLLTSSPLGAVSGLATEEAVHQRFTSLVARGASKDIGSALSLVLGVLCFFISLLVRVYFQVNIATAVLTGVWSIGLTVCLQWLFLYFFQYSHPAYAFTHHFLPKYCYTLLFLPLLYLLNRGLSQALNPKEGNSL